jgi:endonuclease G
MRYAVRLAFALGVWLTAAAGAQAKTAADDCPQFFPYGREPVVTLASGVSYRELCFPGFAVLHSAATRTPLWSAEVMSAATVALAQQAKRYGDFHAEPRLAGEGATPRDYDCSGYDRGHMTPVGDFGVKSDENDTFTMANMVPQTPNLNEGLWARLERRIQDVATADGTLYILTGPVFGPSPAMLNGRVAVPALTWKAIYDPKRHAAAAYLGTNEAIPAYRVVGIAELTQLIGFDPFPGVDAAEKASLLDLPPVEPKYMRKKPVVRTCRARGPTH